MALKSDGTSKTLKYFQMSKKNGFILHVNLEQCSLNLRMQTDSQWNPAWTARGVFFLLLCWCFTALRHFSGHFGPGQLTYPHCSWASLLCRLLGLYAHSFASNWQLPFFNQQKGENGHRNFLMTLSPWNNVARCEDQSKSRILVYTVSPDLSVWNDLCLQQKLTSAQADQSSLSAWRNLASLATHWVHSEDWSDWVDAQVNLSLCWVHKSFCHLSLSTKFKDKIPIRTNLHC